MVLTDTHTHIYYEKEPEELKAKMQRCFSQGVHRLFLPNVDLESVTMIDRMVAEYPNNCFAMLGLHPCDVKTDFMQVLDKMQQLAPQRKIYAIGEIGIDLYWDKSTLDIQKIAFTRQIRWAKELNLPFVIHCREAFDEVFEVLEQEKHPGMRGIFHCFTGTLEQAQKAIELGFYLGIGGVVTYKKAGLDQVLKDIPLAKIVLETDSPYLAPVPYRGKQNESSYLVHVAQKVADIYQIELSSLAEHTTKNSIEIFGI